MEKTIQIFIASTAFHCTEEAYARLSQYIERLKNHFKGEAENAEILRDIESRIAEKLLERKKSLITIEDVTSVIAEIGEVSELEDDVEDTKTADPRPDRRLYRDTDNAMIAGVSSGIAAYFDASPLLIRLIFLGSIFFGGTGIFVYLVLWVLVPEAKTAAQKLEMRGRQVTFEAISRIVKEGVKDNRKNNALYGATSAFRIAIGRLLRFIGKAFGFLIALGSFFWIIGLTAFLGVIITNWNAPYNDIPLRESSSTLLLNTAMFAGFLAAIIPLIFIFALGIKLFRQQNVLSTAVGFGLIGAWALALIVTGVSGVKIAGDYYNYVETNPEYAIATETRELAAFDRLIIDNEHVRIEQGENYGAVIEGYATDLQHVSFTEEDGTLTVNVSEEKESCIFCDHSSVDITILVPSLSSIEVDNGSVSFENYTGDELLINSNRGYIYGQIAVDRLTTTSDGGTMQFDLTVRELSIDSEGTNMHLSGEAETANIILRNASLNADELVIQNATLEADSSYAELDVRGTFTETVDDESTVTNEAQLRKDEADVIE